MLGDDRLSANEMDPDVGVNIDHAQRYQVVDGQFGDGYQVSDEMSNLIWAREINTISFSPI